LKVEKLSSAYEEFISLLEDNLGAEVDSAALLTLLLVVLSAIAHKYEYPEDLIPRLYKLAYYIFDDS